MGKADETRERILTAAMAEFATYGIAGARVDRIARTAGCNKNLIYVYFENKERLFATVLRLQLPRIYEEMTFTPHDLPGYAERVFDFGVANPELMRLLAWSRLEHQAETLAMRDAAIGRRQDRNPLQIILAAAEQLVGQALIHAVTAEEQALRHLALFGAAVLVIDRLQIFHLRHIERTVEALDDPSRQTDVIGM